MRFQGGITPPGEVQGKKKEHREEKTNNDLAFVKQ